MIVWGSIVILTNIVTVVTFGYYRGYYAGVRFADRTWVEYLEEHLSD